MSSPSPADRIAALTHWLLSEARFIDATAAIAQAIVDRLRAAGLPIVRFTTGVPRLHPQVDAFSTLWELGKGLTFRQYRRDDEASRTYPESPLFLAYENGQSTRWPLEGPPRPGEYELLAEMRQRGLTDYLVLALPFGDGSHKAMTFATDQPGGFSADDVAVIEGIRHALAMVVERRSLRLTAETLMNTYVGPIAGQRVLDGAIKRGMGETIGAAIWFCDLKGFTALSERLPVQALIDLLNAYFDAMGAGIEAEGGEILKFIGDAVLAVFQPKNSDHADAAHRALRAAQAAIAALTEVRTASGEPVDCGIGLHVGDVHYGNVGAADRLDFTVIGPAVNQASRIEALTRDLPHRVLVSSAFAALHGGAFAAVGTFALKGITEPVAILAPRS